MQKERNKFKRDLFCNIINSETGSECFTEYYFHPTRKWRFDYAIPACKIAIEIEGGVWSNGRHTRPKGYIGDLEKYNAAVMLGWRLLRFTPEQQFTTNTIETIKKIIQNE